MPFSKYVVDPKHIEIMRLAFQKVCDALKLKCDPNDLLTDFIVMKIIELAKDAVRRIGGELCADAGVAGEVQLSLDRPCDTAGARRSSVEQ
jgi:hypothetical protein